GFRLGENTESSFHHTAVLPGNLARCCEAHPHFIARVRLAVAGLTLGGPYSCICGVLTGPWAAPVTSVRLTGFSPRLWKTAREVSLPDWIASTVGPTSTVPRSTTLP